MMVKTLTDELGQKEITDFHSTLLMKVRSLVEMSRSNMSTMYDIWDYHDMAYRGERRADKEDLQSMQKGEPMKVALPLTYAQVQVFVSFMFSQYFQRPSFFQLVAAGQEDYDSALVGEAFLNRDLNANQWSVKLYQWLVDIGKFGIGIFKHGWRVETSVVYRKETVPAPILPFLNIKIGKDKETETREQAVSFEGNRLFNISPFRFFPDPRLPISRYDEGEFVASEDEYSIVTLQELETQGEVAGVDFIPAFSKQAWDKRKTWFSGMQSQTDATGTMFAKDIKSTVCVTEVQIKIVPSKWKLSNDEVLGDETYPILYNVWYANDSRIIKAEPLGYEHNKFTYNLSQLAPDQHRLVNEGVAGLVCHLQDIINWLLNARITSVRKVISNLLVVDPQKIDIADLVNRKSVIRTKPGIGSKGIESAIKQLQVQDVTQAHMQDIAVLQTMMGTISGMNESALGQFASGRRSAAEAKNVYSATLGRLQMLARIIWDSGLAPLGRNMLSNLRAGVDNETYVRVMGTMASQEAFNGFVKANKESLIGNYDLDVYDGTMASDRADMADILQNVLTEMLANPEAAGMFNLNPAAILREIALLRGIKHMNRFDLKPDPATPTNPNGPDPGTADITPLLAQLAGQFGINVTSPLSVPGVGGPGPAVGAPSNTSGGRPVSGSNGGTAQALSQLLQAGAVGGNR